MHACDVRIEHGMEVLLNELFVCILQDTAGAVGNKANQAGNVAGETWEQTKGKANEGAGAAGDKANQAKGSAGNVLQQVGNTAASAYEKAKDTVTPNKQT
jgi:uncharacterized protein YjbJ (UPF0337 family)